MTAPQNPNLAANLPPQGPRRVVYLEANRAPTVLDSKYRDGSFYEFNTEWRDKSTTPPSVWKLVNILSKTNAIWVLNTGGTGTLLYVDVDTATAPGVDPVTPLNGVLSITGGQVATGTVGTNVIRTHTTALNQFAIEIQRTTTAASTTASLNGVAHFNNADFTIDSNGFVSLLGGAAISAVNVDASTAPGTDPVVPDINGQMTVSGGQVAAGTIGANVIRTNSLAANTYTIQVQQTDAVAAKDTTKNGVAHFNSAQFTDDEGFISILGGTPFTSINIQRFTSTGAFTYTPTANTKFAIFELQAAGAGSGGTAATVGAIAIAAGGSGGAYAKFLLTAAQIGASLTGSVGAGGAGGAAGNNAGSNGGNTTLATAAPWTCNGGTGGAGGASAVTAVINIATGGTVTTGTGTVILTRSGGSTSNGTANSANVAISGAGGSSTLGLGGPPLFENVGPNGSAGVAGTGYGAGASGACCFGTIGPFAGAAGTDGIVIVTEFI